MIGRGVMLRRPGGEGWGGGGGGGGWGGNVHFCPLLGRDARQPGVFDDAAV